MSDVAGRIFLSYRREDTRHLAGRLADRIAGRFGAGSVFMDVDGIEPGADFTRAIAAEVGSCDLLIALIGRGWTAPEEGTGRSRLHRPDDFVNVEIRTALERGIRVIPVLVDEARMPTADELPQSLRLLATRQAARVDHDTFASDVEPLLAAVERALRAAAVERTTPRLAVGKNWPAPVAAPAEARIPPARAALRIALWWLVYFLALMEAFAIGSTLLWPTQGAGSSTISTAVVFLGMLGGVVFALRREIGKQRRVLTRAPVPPEESAVSVRHVRKVAVICAVVALAFGLLVAVTPPGASPGSAVTTAPR